MVMEWMFRFNSVVGREVEYPRLYILIFSLTWSSSKRSMCSCTRDCGIDEEFCR